MKVSGMTRLNIAEYKLILIVVFLNFNLLLFDTFLIPSVLNHWPYVIYSFNTFFRYPNNLIPTLHKVTSLGLQKVRNGPAIQ